MSYDEALVHCTQTLMKYLKGDNVERKYIIQILNAHEGNSKNYFPEVILRLNKRE